MMHAIIVLPLVLLPRVHTQNRGHIWIESDKELSSKIILLNDERLPYVVNLYSGFSNGMFSVVVI